MALKDQQAVSVKLINRATHRRKIRTKPSVNCKISNTYIIVANSNTHCSYY